ncbi:hypothetical protein GCM10010103_38230 [Streptomyces paradoxus]
MSRTRAWRGRVSIRRPRRPGPGDGPGRRGLRHLDRRAAKLCPGPAWEEWAAAMARAAAGPDSGALGVLADRGRTKRIRNTARAGLTRRGGS